MTARRTDGVTCTAFFPRWPLHAQSHVPSRILMWLDRQRQRVRLSQLDDRLLDDIGVSRRDAEAESRRWD